MSMGELAVMDHTGDTKLMWDSDNETEVANARRTFDEMKKKGFTAYSVYGKDGAKGEQIREFDPKAEKIILVPQMQGG